MVQHEVSEGFTRKIGRNYYMILTVDGQRKQKKTGTSDCEAAADMLEEWKIQERMGLTQDTRLRYEKMRDIYIGGGKAIQESILRDLNEFFKGIRIAAITVDKMKDFRHWRESKTEELERKEETLAKEISWRVKKAGEVTPTQRKKIETEAQEWVENGVKATTNKRLSILRAMFNHLADEGKIRDADVPSFPIVSGVDNKRRGFLEKEDLPKILDGLAPNLRPIVRFIYETGMRSGAAEKLTWDMVDRNVTEIHIPGNLLKNREDLVLPLVDKTGKTLPCFNGTVAYIKNAIRGNGPLFDSTDLRGQWRQVCDTLKFGSYDKKTRSYRGLKLHDFRRSACRNMITARVPQVVAMQISGHKTDSIFKRYAITDKSTMQEVLSQAQ